MQSNWLDFTVMLSRARKIVLSILLAALPLQGVAATLSFLYCHGDARAHAAVHDGAAHGHAAEHDGSHDALPGDEGSPASHLCCNATVSMPSTLTLPAGPPDFEIRALVPAPFHDLFIPDRPQRPPLA